MNPMVLMLRSLRRLLMIGLAAFLAFNLAACSSISADQARDAAQTAVGMAKQAADLSGNEALTSALTPVVNLLKETEKDVKSGDIDSATSTMQGFRGLWKTAQPVVKLAAGSNYGIIDTGVNLVLNTFGGDQPPTKDTALTAVKGLIGPLSKLLG